MDDMYTSKAKHFIIYHNLKAELLEPLTEALKDCAKQHMLDMYFPKKEDTATKPKLVPPTPKPAPSNVFINDFTQRVDPKAYNPYIA